MPEKDVQLRNESYFSEYKSRYSTQLIASNVNQDEDTFSAVCGSIKFGVIKRIMVTKFV